MPAILTLAQQPQKVPQVPGQDATGQGPGQIGAAPEDGSAPITQQSGGASDLPLDRTRDNPGNSIMSFLPIILIMGVFMFILMGGQRKEKKRRKKMLETLHKGDKVQTVGGILGTIVEMRENEVVVKVDENTNTRIKFGKSAVQTVLSEREES